MKSFRNLRKKHFKNNLIGYLNVKSLGNKIIDQRAIVNTFNSCEPLSNFIIT